MGQPCAQGERLATLEAIVEQNSETMSDMRDISRKTYEVLSVISEQGAELRELRATTIRHSKDLEEAFLRIRAEEKLSQEHSIFITEDKAKTARFYQFTLPILGTVSAAAIIAATAFAFNMIDSHNYTQKLQPAPAGYISAKPVPGSE